MRGLGGGHKLWHSMTRTRNDVEELGSGVEKVEDLRQEKEEHRLAVASQNPNARECHASKVAKRVAHKHFGRISK